MNFFDHKDLGNHLLQLCPEVVKHPLYVGLLYLNISVSTRDCLISANVGCQLYIKQLYGVLELQVKLPVC